MLEVDPRPSADVEDDSRRIAHNPGPEAAELARFGACEEAVVECGEHPTPCNAVEPLQSSGWLRREAEH